MPRSREVDRVPPLVGRRRRAITTDVSPTTSSKACATVAVIIPGYTPAPEQRLHFRPERDVVEERVPPHTEHRVGDDEGNRRVAVPAVHDGEMVEAEQPVEPGKACQQQHLDEREVRRQQACEPGEARHEPGGVIHLRDVAVRVPELDDPCRVADQQRERDGGPPPHTDSVP